MGLKVIFFDVVNADSILIQTDSQTVLIDTGSSQTAAKTKKFIDALQRNAVTKIDKIIITHSATDHSGNLQALVNPSSKTTTTYPYLKNITVSQVYYNGIDRPNDTHFKAYKTACDKKNITLQPLTAGDVLTLGSGITFEVLWPTQEARTYANKIIQQYDLKQRTSVGGSVNATSIVGRLVYNQFTVMLTGDCYATWKTIKKYGPGILELYTADKLKSTVLKAAHHACNNENPIEMIKAVDPDYYVISNAGYSMGTAYKNIPKIIPKFEAIQTLLKAGIDQNNIFCTGFDGDISITSSNGNSWSVTKQKNVDWFDIVYDRQQNYYDSVDADNDGEEDPIKTTMIIYVLNVGKADAIVIQILQEDPSTKKNVCKETILIDTASNDVEKSQKPFMTYLEKLKITTINHLIITHPHSDHDGNVNMLLNPTSEDIQTYPCLQNISISKIYHNGFLPNTTAIAKLRTDATKLRKTGDTEQIKRADEKEAEANKRERDIERFNQYKQTWKNLGKSEKDFIQLTAGDILKFTGDITFKVLWPTQKALNILAAGKDANTSSIVGKLVYNKFSMLFLGDCYAPLYRAEPIEPSKTASATALRTWEQNHEDSLLDLYPSEIQANVIKAAHHAISPGHHPVESLKKINAKHFVISYTKTKDETTIGILQNCIDAGIPLENVYRTANNYAVNIKTDGETYSVTPATSVNWKALFGNQLAIGTNEISNYEDEETTTQEE